MWDPKMGGFPQSEAIPPQYFPGIRLVFFYEFSAVYWVALYPDDVRGWPRDVRVLAANSGGGAGRAVGGGGVYVCADFFGVSVGWALCQDGGDCAVSVDYLGRWNGRWRRGG